MQKGQLSQCNAFEMMVLLSYVMNCAILEETVFFCATKRNHVVLLKYNPFTFSLWWLPYNPWFSLGNKAGLSEGPFVFVRRPLLYVCQKASFFLERGGRTKYMFVRGLLPPDLERLFMASWKGDLFTTDMECLYL